MNRKRSAPGSLYAWAFERYHRRKAAELRRAQQREQLTPTLKRSPP